MWNHLSDFSKRKNIIDIKTQVFIPHSRWSYLRKGGPIVYDTSTLKQLNNSTKLVPGIKYCHLGLYQGFAN